MSFPREFARRPVCRWQRAALCVLFCFAVNFPVSSAVAADGATGKWENIAVAPARDVVLEGPVGVMLQRGLNRLTIPPFTAAFIRSDISYEDVHCFYDYSGSNVGEALEVWSLNTPMDRLQPKAFVELLATIEPIQKPDGHFGVDINVAKPIGHANIASPVLWGNARMLAGLMTCWNQLHDEAMLRMAKKLGDYYVRTGDALCSPKRVEQYKLFVNANEGIESCYFPAIEGLVMLYAETKDQRYLEQARKMADMFLEHFHELKNGHWSGYLMDWRGVLFLYEVAGERRCLDACQAKWEWLLQNKISLGGGIVVDGIDTCFFEDWLRLSLELWRLTGNTRCLDAVERLVHNVYGEQQTPNGGFGYRCWEGDIGAASNGVIRTSVPNSPWCCDYMGPGGLVYYKSFLATGDDKNIYVNFFDDFTSRVKAAGGGWQVKSRNRQDLRHGQWTTDSEPVPLRTSRGQAGFSPRASSHLGVQRKIRQRLRPRSPGKDERRIPGDWASAGQGRCCASRVQRRAESRRAAHLPGSASRSGQDGGCAVGGRGVGPQFALRHSRSRQRAADVAGRRGCDRPIAVADRVGRRFCDRGCFQGRRRRIFPGCD